MTFKDNKILVAYLKEEDSALYSCQLNMRPNATHEELVHNSTNFKLKVYPFLKGGLDPRSPKVALKLTFLFGFAIFCSIIFMKSKIHLHFMDI